MNAAALTKALGGTWLGTYGMVRCLVHNDRTPSLKVWDSPNGARFHCFAGCDWREVRDSAKALGLIGDADAIHQHNNFLPARIDTVIDVRKAQRAYAIWRSTTSLKGTVAESYLRCHRGIELNTYPSSLRFHPSLRHPNGMRYPAIVSAVTRWPAREVRAIHRTYLRANGSGKADGTPCKLMLGRCVGGAVRLSAPTQTVLVGEGIETCLSAFHATGLPTWAALSTSGLVGLILPPLPLAAEIIIAADNDTAGLNAARRAADRWIAEGRTVRVAIPSVEGADFNDILREAS